MRTTTLLPALAALVALGGCKSLEVKDLNNPGLEQLQTSPSRAGVLTAATGLLIGTRGGTGGAAGFGSQNGYVSMLGILGRESYNFDPADPRFVTEMLIGPLDGGSPAFGGNLWAQPYANIRNANIVLGAVNVVTGMTDEEKEGVRGFAQTIKALDFLMVINTRDTSGAVIDVPSEPGAEPGPIASKAEVFAYIAALLDSAVTHLNAAGSSFAFPLSSGFAGFNAPSTFLQFNRALRARAAVYTNDWSGALTALGQSFVGTGSPLTLGVYHTFSQGSGDQSNQLYDPIGSSGYPRAIFAHPSIITDAQLRSNGQPDLRATTKTTALSAAKVVQGISTNLAFNIYTSPSSPVPIIRNEELILLRAEANIGLGNLGTAVSDIDFIRQTAGGLPAYSGPNTAAALRTELLYDKRYSLMFEGGHRWIDMRHYGLLNTLPLAVSAHKRFAKFPFPLNECNPRSSPPAGCGVENGF